MANDNQISDFDAHGLCEMPMIATLALQNNNILTLPPQLGNCTQLRFALAKALQWFDAGFWAVGRGYSLYTRCSIKRDAFFFLS